MPGLGDLFGGGDNMSSFNFGSLYDNPDASFFEVPGTTNYGDIQATGVGGPGTSLAYNTNGDLIETQGTGGDISGGMTTGGGSAGSAIADLIKKYGLPALLAGLAVKDRQKATGGGYGKAYQSPSPLTRTISQGKYGPIAKYAAEGGIIQGFNKGGSPRGSAGGSFGQLDQAPNPGALASGIASQYPYNTGQNAKAIEAFARYFPPSAIGMTIKNAIEQIRAGNTEGLVKDTVKGMVPFSGTVEKALAGDLTGAATSVIPSGVKALYNLITNPETGRNVSSQVPDEITSTLADYNPEDLRTAVMATIPEFDTAQANTALSRSFTPSVAQPSGMQDFATFEDMARGAQAQKEQQAANGEVVSFGVPDQNTEQYVDLYPLAQPEAQGTDLGISRGFTAPETSNNMQGSDLGAFNYDGMGGVSDTDPMRGPSVYGNYDSGGGNFNDSSGPGEGGFGGGSYSGGYGGSYGGNLSESGGSGGFDRGLGYDLMNYAQGGGIAAMAKGRFLRGPGDGVSDSIPATIDGNQPAALADGEFVIPARVVSELGNGSSEAGARKLHAMMVRIQKDRRGAKNIAANTKVDRHLPA